MFALPQLESTLKTISSTETSQSCRHICRSVCVFFYFNLDVSSFLPVWFRMFTLKRRLPPAAGERPQTSPRTRLRGQRRADGLYFFSHCRGEGRGDGGVGLRKGQRSQAWSEVISWCEGSPGTWCSCSGCGSPSC